MSTYLYLVCKDHDPPLDSYWIGEVAQHLSDLPAVQQYIAKRKELVHVYNMDNIEIENNWCRAAARFLSQHPNCRIGIRDEYNREHPAVAGEPLVTAEQKARDLLERMGIEDAQQFTAGDLVELANLISKAGA